MQKIIKKCPICREERDMTYPALSRRDNKTEICSDCGIEEAILDYIKYLKEVNL